MGETLSLSYFAGFPQKSKLICQNTSALKRALWLRKEKVLRRNRSEYGAGGGSVEFVIF